MSQYSAFRCALSDLQNNEKRLISNDLRFCVVNPLKVAFAVLFHCFRHTYASLQLEMGTDIYTVQHLLNHKNVSTTQIYASHADPKTREAANRITLTNVKDGLQTTESENNQTETNRKEDINKTKK